MTQIIKHDKLPCYAGMSAKALVVASVATPKPTDVESLGVTNGTISFIFFVLPHFSTKMRAKPKNEGE